MRVCAAHDIPIIPRESDCAICRRRLAADPSLTAESLVKVVSDEPRADQRAITAKGLADVRAGLRQGRIREEQPALVDQ